MCILEDCLIVTYKISGILILEQSVNIASYPFYLKYCTYISRYILHIHKFVLKKTIIQQTVDGSYNEPLDPTTKGFYNGWSLSWIQLKIYTCTLSSSVKLGNTYRDTT